MRDLKYNLGGNKSLLFNRNIKDGFIKRKYLYN